MYTLKEASEVTGISIYRIRAMVLSGTVTGAVKVGNTIMLTERTVRYIYSVQKAVRIYNQVISDSKQGRNR